MASEIILLELILVEHMCAQELFLEENLQKLVSERIPSSGSVEEVLNIMYELIDPLTDENIQAIGIGVPSVVDIENGIVYDVQNIPSWKKVELKKLMEEKYHLPVSVNNDANCFALGEKYFGKGKEFSFDDWAYYWNRFGRGNYH